MENSCYRFAGVVNFFRVSPEFVYPIFEKDGKYFFQKTKNTIITSFNEVKDNLHISKISFLNKDTTKFINIKESYSVGDEAVVAFKIDTNNFLISDISYFVYYISKFVTDDHILIEEIDTFLDTVKRRKYVKKNKLIN